MDLTMTWRRTVWTLVLGGAVVVGSLACDFEDVDSEDIATKGLAVRATFTADGGGTIEAEVELPVGGLDANTFARLTGDDRLVLTAGGTELDMEQQTSGLGRVYYTATIGDTANAASPRVTLERTSDDGGRVSATMPPAFSITAPSAGASIARAMPLELRWDPSDAGSTVDIELRGSCIESYDVDSLADTGSLTIPADTLSDPDEPDESCDVTATVTRHRSGAVDYGFDEGGDVQARQVRERTFRSVP